MLQCLVVCTFGYFLGLSFSIPRKNANYLHVLVESTQYVVAPLLNNFKRISLEKKSKITRLLYLTTIINNHILKVQIQ